MVGLEAPGVEADGDVIGERVGAGEVEVDQAGELLAEEEHIVGKQVGVDHALRQAARPRAFEQRELALDRVAQSRLHGVRARGGRNIERPPAVNRERVAPALRKIRARKMQARKRVAKRRAMGRARAADPHAVEEGHDRGRPPGDEAQHVAGPVLDRLRTGQPARRQILHQREEERNVLERDALLIERQDEIAAAGVDQEIGILHAFGNALVGQEFRRDRSPPGSRRALRQRRRSG